MGWSWYTHCSFACKHKIHSELLFSFFVLHVCWVVSAMGSTSCLPNLVALLALCSCRLRLAHLTSQVSCGVIACTLEKQRCYVSKVFGYYTVVWPSLLCEFYEKIHAVGADTWVNFTRLPQNVLQTLYSLSYHSHAIVVTKYFAKSAICLTL